MIEFIVICLPILIKYYEHVQSLCTETIDVAVPPSVVPTTSQHPEYPVPFNFTKSPTLTFNKPKLLTAILLTGSVQLSTINLSGLGVLLGVIVGVLVGVGVGVLV